MGEHASHVGPFSYDVIIFNHPPTPPGLAVDDEKMTMEGGRFGCDDVIKICTI